MVYVIDIPGEPVAKARPRATRTGHIYTPSKTKHQEAEIALAWVRKYGDTKTEKPVSIEITFFMKKSLKSKDRYVQKRPDIDNLIKTVLDGLNNVAYKDDKQVYCIKAVKQWGEPSTKVMLEVLDNDDF